MNTVLQNIILKLEKTERLSIPFLKVYFSKNDNINLPQISNPYLYLVLQGRIQFPDMNEVKEGEYFISAIDSPKNVKIISPHFSASKFSYRFSKNNFAAGKKTYNGWKIPKEYPTDSNFVILFSKQYKNKLPV